MENIRIIERCMDAVTEDEFSLTIYKISGKAVGILVAAFLICGVIALISKKEILGKTAFFFLAALFACSLTHIISILFCAVDSNYVPNGYYVIEVRETFDRSLLEEDFCDITEYDIARHYYKAKPKDESVLEKYGYIEEKETEQCEEATLQTVTE